MVESFYLHNVANFTCPAKTLAFFAHNQEIMYEQAFSEQFDKFKIIRLFDDCKSIE